MPAKGKGQKTYTVAKTENEVRALELRKCGLSYPAIAEEMGVCTATAFKAVRRGLQRLIDECKQSASELLQLELERLDRLEAALRAGIEQGEPQSIEAARRIIDQRCKLLGLNPPTKIAPTDPEGVNPYQGVSDAQLMALFQQMAQSWESPR